ncbi:glycosyltransferase family 4 protein [Filimonas effusa]|uniref:Glycosyltransferase family 1 protein n=1 Tax=Filimonas effusa TaxID=2508721 RepID=A0A4Q1D374_9BACT|nr:glycosyltransferase family 1 protein [Filimonas effusa]RXK81862.1 glycosyltransferase family 1 protein [Filimonas effusa]
MARVYVNGKFLSQKMSGVQRYASELLRHYYALDKDVALVSPAERRSGDDFQLPIPVMTTGSKAGLWWEQAQLPWFLSGKGRPLLLNLCNMAPVMYRNKITCIHDIAFLRYPQFFSTAFRTYYKAIIPAIIKSSKHIITVSEFSRSELMDYYKLRPERVSVIPNAGFRSGQGQEGAEQELPLPVRRPYFLFVGSVDPRKNLLFLLRAYEAAQLKETDLVVAGGGYASFNDALLKDIHLYHQHPNIHFIGHVPDALLTQYYNYARAVIVPSFYEGFGLPVAEGLSAHCEVLASDIPIFREVAGAHAFYFDPFKPDALITLMRERDGTSRPDGEDGYSFIHRRYSWEKSANALGDCISAFRD